MGDVIVAYDGDQIDRSKDLPPMVGGTKVGTTVPMDVIREGDKRTLRVTIGELPAEDEVRVAAAEPRSTTEKQLGLSVADLSEQQRRQRNIEEDYGVLVSAVESGPAARAGIRKGDVILMVNNIKVKDSTHFKEIVEELPSDKSVPVLVHRRGGPIFLALKPQGGD